METETNRSILTRAKVLVARIGLSAAIMVLASCHAAPMPSPDWFPAPPARLHIDGQCGHLPRLVGPKLAPSIHCVALVDDNLIFPRSVEVINKDILLVDKGANLFDSSRPNGALYLYKRLTEDTDFQRIRIVGGLDNPSGLAVGGTNELFVFVSTRDQVLRIEPYAADPKQRVTVVIDELPTSGWHSVTGIHIQGDALYVSIPSATDHCEGDSLRPSEVVYPCTEVDPATDVDHQTAAIRRYRIDPQGNVSSEFDLMASGLRNALAIQSHPAHDLLYAVDNGWDQIASIGTDYSKTPYDELNVIPLSANAPPLHYGWPYCFDHGRVSPPYIGFNLDCTSFHQPTVLLPPHSAPLGIALVESTLWINLHGFAPAGHRTVRIQLDPNGIPIKPLDEMIHWQFEASERGKNGRPFDLAVYDEDALLVTDDWNGALFMVVLNP